MPAACHIVVGVDGSRHSRDAIGLAKAILGSREGSLVIARAYPHTPLPDAGYNAAGSPSPRQAAERYLERVLDELDVSATGLAVSDASPASALHQIATDTGADLIVVGSSHHGGFGRLLLGDDGAETVHGAPCAVAVAPSGWRSAHRLQTIGVAFDGSAEAHQALAEAERIARGSDARLRLVHVIRPPAPALTAPPALTDWSAYEAAAFRNAREALEPTLSLLGARGDAEIRLGDPVKELGASSQQLKLLVVGSRSHGPVLRVLTGSTANGLLHTAACPLVVVPRPRHVEAEPSDRAQQWSPVGQLLG